MDNKIKLYQTLTLYYFITTEMWYVIWLLLASENCTCNFYYQMSTFKLNSLAKKFSPKLMISGGGGFVLFFFSEDFLRNNIVSVSFN